MTVALPTHYTPLYRRFVRFASVMVFIALLSGVAIQESSKKAPISPMLPAGLHLEAIFSASIVHGHVFLLGVLIPLAVLWLLYLGLMLGGQPLSQKALRWGTWLYLPGVVLSLLLLLYKGYFYLISVRLGHVNLATVEQDVFFGLPALRAALYGLSHSAMSIGLGIFIVALWRSLPKKSDVTS